MRIRRTLLAGVALLALPVSAQAAPPPNDAASQAIVVSSVSAENGPVAAREGVVDLSEAGPDAGTPRCLGARSFARTAWFRVPGGPAQRVRLDALTPSGQPDEAADLAAFVQPVGATAPRTSEPQACDGPAAGSTDPGVELMVPPGQDVLVQVGRSAGQTATGVVLSVATDPLRQLAQPNGDLATDQLSIPFARVRTQSLRGATLTEEDPAEPACATAASVWRKREIRQSGLQVAATRGRDASALTVFVGSRPKGENAVACDIDSSGKTSLIEVPFRAHKGDTAWLRIGTDTNAGVHTRSAISGPCDRTPLHPVNRTKVAIAAPRSRARRRRALHVRLTEVGPCLAGARIRVRRGKRVVARRTLRHLVRGTVTVRVPRIKGAKAPRGRYRVSVAGRTPKGKRRVYGTSRTLRLR